MVSYNSGNEWVGMHVRERVSGRVREWVRENVFSCIESVLLQRTWDVF